MMSPSRVVHPHTMAHVLSEIADNTELNHESDEDIAQELRQAGYVDLEIEQIIAAWRRSYPITPPSTDSPSVMAEWLCNRQADTLAMTVVQMDAGFARQALTIAIDAYARSVAMSSMNEIHRVTYDEVLMDLLYDARQYTPGS